MFDVIVVIAVVLLALVLVRKAYTRWGTELLTLQPCRLVVDLKRPYDFKATKDLKRPCPNCNCNKLKQGELYELHVWSQSTGQMGEPLDKPRLYRSRAVKCSVCSVVFLDSWAEDGAA